MESVFTILGYNGFSTVAGVPQVNSLAMETKARSPADNTDTHADKTGICATGKTKPTYLKKHATRKHSCS